LHLATKAAAAVFFLVLAGGRAASAREQVVIQKSASNTQLRAGDTWLDQNAPGTANGGGNTLFVQARTGQARRALVEFDLSILPNAGIKSAMLTLTLSSTSPRVNRTYFAYLLSSFWDPASASWNDRVGTTAWGAAGGDYNAGIPASGNSTTVAANTAANTNVSWNVTQAAQVWYNSGPNFGILVKDGTEGTGTTRVSQFYSVEESTAPASRPSLTLAFLQNVTNLAATPGNATITLNWVYPNPISGGTILENYSGVVILRRAAVPVDKGSYPADGTNPNTLGLCSTVGNGTVVFVGTTANTSFTDSNVCGGLTNGTMYYYKVFTYDTANNYSTSPAGLGSPNDGASTFTAEIGAMPNPAGSTQGPLWMIGTHSSNLAPPGIMPSSQIDIGSDTDIVFAVDSNTGQRLYAPQALGGIITGRPPILDSSSASIGKQVAYFACQDNYVYAIDTTTGAILWEVDPGGSTTNLFQGGASVLLKAYATASYNRTTDLVVVGTRNGATTTGNTIYAIDGNTGAAVWNYTGSPGMTTALDIMSSTPLVDYVHNVIWVTSHANNGSAQPNLWQLNANTGAVLFETNLAGGDIDSSPSITQASDVMFVTTNGISGTSNGRIYALNPATGGPLGGGSSLAFYDGGDGAIVGFPFVVSPAAPYTVVFTSATKVQAVQFTPSTNTFSLLWTSPAITTPSGPVVLINGGMVYVGGGDGYLYELSLATGAIVNKVVVNTFYPAIVGTPALDVLQNHIYVSTTTNDQRAYAFVIPF
jgi:outer membrane protein assembly factor BamB